jgi:hypothetical protein
LYTPSNTGTPAARAERQPEVGAKIVGSGDQRARLWSDLGRGKHARSGFDHCEHRLAHRLGHSPHETRRSRAGHDHEIRPRPGHAIHVERMPFRPDAVDSDRHGHPPLRRRRIQSGVARGGLVRRLHRIFEVEHHHVGVGRLRFGDCPRVGCRQEQH